MRDRKKVLCRRHSCSQLRYPRFRLCPECYAEGPHEARIVEAVVRYLSRPKFCIFFIETERDVQMGSDTRRSDVTLMDGKQNLAAIAECKRSGVIAYGHDQLHSYLSATDTPFGIFANSTDSGLWTFYKNLRRNHFEKITRSQFEDGIIALGEHASEQETEVARAVPGAPSGRGPDSPRLTHGSRARYARQRQIAKRAKRRSVRTTR